MRFFSLLAFLLLSLPAFTADCAPRTSALWRNPAEIQVTWLYFPNDCPADHFLVFAESYLVGEDGKLVWHKPARQVAMVTADERVPSFSHTLQQAESEATHLIRIQAVTADGKRYAPSDWEEVAPFKPVADPMDHAIKNARMTITSEPPPDAPPIPKAAQPAAKPAVKNQAMPVGPETQKPQVAQPAKPEPAKVAEPARVKSSPTPPPPCGQDAEDGIEGTVFGADGKPAANVKVQLDYKFRGQPPLTEYTTTDALGRYCFPGLHLYVRYKITLADENLETKPRQQKHTFKDRHIDDSDLTIQ